MKEAPVKQAKGCYLVSLHLKDPWNVMGKKFTEPSPGEDRLVETLQSKSAISGHSHGPLKHLSLWEQLHMTYTEHSICYF